jgi:hypothetical protein
MQPYRRPYHIEGDGPTVFAHACKMGLAGLATAKAQRVFAAGRAIEVTRVRITEAGRRALTGAE